MGEEKKIGKIAVLIMGIALLCKVFGFLRELMLARFFGTSGIVDIYLMSITIPSILFGALPSLGIGVTPVYFEIEDNKKKNDFLNSVLLMTIIFSCLCVMITYFFSEKIVGITAAGFTDNAKEQTISFLKITVWSVVFNTPIQIIVSYLNCKEKYIQSNLANLTVSIIQILFIIMAANININLLPLGFLLPFVFQFIWGGLVACHIGFKPQLRISYDRYLKKLLVLSIPIGISNILVDINGFVDKILSSFLPSGRMAALNYAFTLRAVIVTTISTVITTIFYPRISQLAAANKMDLLRKEIIGIIDGLVVFIVPLNFLAVIFSNEIVEIVLMRGSFDRESVLLTKVPFIMYMLSLSFILIRDLATKVLYAKGDTKINLYLGTITIGLNIIISLIIVHSMEHVGLALATSISAIITFPLYILKIKKVVAGMELKSSLIKAGKVLFASGCMGFAAFGMNYILSYMNNEFLGSFKFVKALEIVVISLLAFIIYVILLYLLKVEEIRAIVKRVKDHVIKRFV